MKKEEKEIRFCIFSVMKVKFKYNTIL